MKKNDKKKEKETDEDELEENEQEKNELNNCKKPLNDELEEKD